MVCITPAFRAALAGMDLAPLEASQDILLGLTRDLRIAYLNPAWTAFARANDGEEIPEHWGLGASYLEAISEPRLREFYERRLRDIAPEKPFRHEYECSSGATFRSFHLHAQVLPDGTSLLLVNTLVRLEPAASVLGPAPDPDPDRYRDPEGLIRQCAECRRTAVPGSGRWEWVPSLLDRHQVQVSHGLCEVCIQVYACT